MRCSLQRWCDPGLSRYRLHPQTTARLARLAADMPAGNQRSTLRRVLCRMSPNFLSRRSPTTISSLPRQASYPQSPAGFTNSTTTAFRCLVCKHGDVVRLESRRGRDMSDQFPELVSEIRPIPQDFVADGELVILDDQSRPQWDRLHSRHTLRHLHRIREAATRDPAGIFAFDLLWLNGCDFPGTTAPRAESGAASHLASQSARPLRTSPEQRLRSSLGDGRKPRA